LVPACFRPPSRAKTLRASAASSKTIIATDDDDRIFAKLSRLFIRKNKSQMVCDNRKWSIGNLPLVKRRDLGSAR
jgi:hypothetical protein